VTKAELALILSGLALSWQVFTTIFTWRREDRTDVEVQIGTDFLPEIDENVVTITAVNGSAAFSVHVIEAGLTRRSNRKARIPIDFEKEGGGTIPGWIKPKDRGVAWVEMKAIDFWNLNRKDLIAFVKTPTDSFYSKPIGTFQKRLRGLLTLEHLFG
jgi:hypothetical protein